ncbi:MAG: glutamyl-tRNA reductase [Candidatus Hydrogenedens sp.]|nr:glutamyl-tRNA reductase [Candidatus Hydrogenedens sp.]
MTIALTGISHQTSPLELRERLAFADGDVPRALTTLQNCFPRGGVVLLNTCNRVEIYANSPEPAESIHDAIRNFLAEWHKLPEQEFHNHLYEHAEEEAISHLFRVASSLDSLVVGEQQISGQVHDAFQKAQEADTADKITNALFQRAFTVAKQVRTRTRIGEGRVSVASVAVELAVSIFMELTGKTVLIIGSGETSELALKSLLERGVGRVLVANRTLANAEALAETCGGHAFGLELLGQHLHLADIIITSTGSTVPILRAEDFQDALRKRNNEPMFAIDIAVPRDIHPAVHRLDNVYCYTMDDLRQTAEQNMNARHEEARLGESIVSEEVRKFMAWQRRLEAEPTIISMSQELHAIRERELERTLAALPDLTDAQRDEVAYLTKRIVNKILQRPLTQLKQEASEEDPHRMLSLVKRLFGLEDHA